MNEDIYEIMMTMREYGGSFASALADAWKYADSDNRTRIETAFPELIERYAEMAKKD